MISVIKKFNFILEKRQKRKLIILFFMMLIGAFLEVLGVSLMLPLVTAIMQPDIIKTNELAKWVCELLDLNSHKTFVIACIIALILVFVIKDLFLIFQYYVQSGFVFNNQFATQKKLLRAYLMRNYEYYLNAQTGEILRVLQTDVAQTYLLLLTLLSLATEGIVSLALIVTIFVVDPLMTAFVAVMMGLVMGIIVKSVKPILRKEGQVFQKHLALTNKWLLQTVNGIKDLKVARKEEFFEDNFKQSGSLMIQAEKRRTVLRNIPRLLIEMVTVCSVLVLIAIMIYNGREIETLIPSIGAFAMAAVKLLPSVNRVVGALNSVAYQEPSLNKVVENLKTLETEQLELDSVYYTEYERKNSELCLQKDILLQGITYQYPNSDKKVLQEADMLIPVGKSVGIVGTSGAGKTTVVDIMMGLLMPQKGQILADGADVMECYEDWLSRISYIPQTIFMLDDTIRANVAFGLKREEQSDEQVWRALEEAQLADFVSSLPEGLDTQIGERGVRVSGGQRQRIGIARALYSNPELLIFDEATSALDNETETAIMESINSLHGKKTMVIIAHRLQTIAECDIVYRVEDGRIFEETGIGENEESL